MAIKEITTEQLILEAAEAEFLDKGYGKARTTEIARRAGVNHSMLHYYFRTKENLFEVVFQKKAQSMSEVMILTFKQNLPFLEKIKKPLKTILTFLLQMRKSLLSYSVRSCMMKKNKSYIHKYPAGKNKKRTR